MRFTNFFFFEKSNSIFCLCNNLHNKISFFFCFGVFWHLVIGHLDWLFFLFFFEIFFFFFFFFVSTSRLQTRLLHSIFTRALSSIQGYTHARTHARTLPRFFLCIVTLCDSLYKGERLFESVSQPFSNNNRATLFKYSLV